jgi:hypothetical protein
MSRHARRFSREQRTAQVLLSAMPAVVLPISFLKKSIYTPRRTPRTLGYESASAFTKAFKKIMGCSPRQYSSGQNSFSIGE